MVDTCIHLHFGGLLLIIVNCHYLVGEKSFTETVSSAFSMVADLVRPGSKRKLDDSDISCLSESTAVMEEEDLIIFDYQHFDADGPSAKSINGNGRNVAILQFNTLNVIGMSTS